MPRRAAPSRRSASGDARNDFRVSSSSDELEPFHEERRGGRMMRQRDLSREHRAGFRKKGMWKRASGALRDSPSAPTDRRWTRLGRSGGAKKPEGGRRYSTAYADQLREEDATGSSAFCLRRASSPRRKPPWPGRSRTTRSPRSSGTISASSARGGATTRGRRRLSKKRSPSTRPSRWRRRTWPAPRSFRRSRRPRRSSRRLSLPGLPGRDRGLAKTTPRTADRPGRLARADGPLLAEEGDNSSAPRRSPRAPSGSAGVRKADFI